MGYGQYSTRSTGRRLKCELLASCDSGYRWAKLWGHNRLLVVYDDRTEYRFHDTAVVTKYRSGKLVIDNGGWATLSTTAAINQALHIATGLPCNAWRAPRGEFYVYVAGFERRAPLPMTITSLEYSPAAAKPLHPIHP